MHACHQWVRHGAAAAFEGKCVEPTCRRREGNGGRRGDYITQNAEGERSFPRMNDAVKRILSELTMTNWPPAVNQGLRYSWGQVTHAKWRHDSLYYLNLIDQRLSGKLGHELERRWMINGNNTIELVPTWIRPMRSASFKPLFAMDHPEAWDVLEWRDRPMTIYAR